MYRPNVGQDVLSNSQFEAMTDCFLCEKKFHTFRRKHRCKACGRAVCANCARTHKLMPISSLVRYNNEPVRVCDQCVQLQNQALQDRRRAADVERARARQMAVLEEEERKRQEDQRRQQQWEKEEEMKRQLRLKMLEEKHFGTRRNRLVRSRSLPDSSCIAQREMSALYGIPPDVFIVQDAERRSKELLMMLDSSNPEMATKFPAYAMENGMTNDNGDPTAVMAIPDATPCEEVDEECAICLESMKAGNAIYTTACGHSFHWNCLKEIQSSDSSNYDKCPSCRATMEEMQIKKTCDHPRVRAGHRFCRDCGGAITEADVKARSNEAANRPAISGGAPHHPPLPASYRASSHGALVRCPQCQIQMRVLPHMYNMRVACPAGHMFLVQVANPRSGLTGGAMGTGLFSSNSRSSGTRQARHPGYPSAQSNYVLF